MTKGQRVRFGVLIVLNLAAIVWLSLGNLRTEFGPLTLFFVAASCAYAPARMIALWRANREAPVASRLVPLRVSMGVTGLITFGPAIAAMAGWAGILPAVISFLVGMILMCWTTAVFSDGYQGLWLDAMIFHGNLTPPEPDWVKYKR
ncbi:hypothetical protein GIY23_05995 [Allosaccharopolyspora coralli]|uniref:Uncharacterized protein n=1 Tax=Allosaccharopolyspora coralli TaxID=2665642 RepID=A0A5Q3QEC2_9PSEU|nr:hypothetical protein [Allosaccharopolyspora coralli]QGK69147.1 hypothetical protein GIY23_05995 [Allosaccharopolyspora coralli]